MIDFLDNLQKLGLTLNQAKVYLALLQLGEATVQQIAKKAEIKRPTAYLVLAELDSKNLARLVVEQNKTKYTAERPDRLLQEIQRRAELAERLLPELRAIYNLDQKRPRIRFYDGKEAVEAIYFEWISKMRQKRQGEVFFYGSLEKISQQFTGVLEKYLRLFEKYQVKTREIIGNSKYEKSYVQKNTTAFHQFRFIPKNKQIFFDFGIYGSEVVIFSLTDDCFAVVIDSKPVTDSFKILFELAWQSAKI